MRAASHLGKIAHLVAVKCRQSLDGLEIPIPSLDEIPYFMAIAEIIEQETGLAPPVLGPVQAKTAPPIDSTRPSDLLLGFKETIHEMYNSQATKYMVKAENEAAARLIMFIELFMEQYLFWSTQDFRAAFKWQQHTQSQGIEQSNNRILQCLRLAYGPHVPRLHNQFFDDRPAWQIYAAVHQALSGINHETLIVQLVTHYIQGWGTDHDTSPQDFVHELGQFRRAARQLDQDFSLRTILDTLRRKLTGSNPLDVSIISMGTRYFDPHLDPSKAYVDFCQSLINLELQNATRDGPPVSGLQSTQALTDRQYLLSRKMPNRA